jgi:hypothetical protein
MANIDTISDETFMQVTEAMGLAGEVMEQHQTETLLVVTLCEEGNNAILGGDTSPEALEKLQNMLDELLERAGTDADGEVLHIHGS